MKAREIIETLNLIPLPHEGGYYKETYRDPNYIPGSVLTNHDGERRFSTCIYYLVTPEAFSALHAVRSAEVFHFYAGDPVRMVQIDAEGQLTESFLGFDLTRNTFPQTVVAPDVWQGTKLVNGGQWALLGCTVAPGFEFEDFSLAQRDELLALYPQHEKTIVEFTHQ